MEKDLYEPIKSYFTDQGFLCDGEVRDVDLYMQREGISAAVELKVKLDFRAVQQAALRQKTIDHVYIGIFTPKNIYSRSFKDRLYLLKRLGIGLLAVSKRTGSVQVLLDPVVHELSAFQKRNLREREALKQEFQHRTLKSNTGGVHQEKLMTGYREDALLVLSALRDLDGMSSVKVLREASGVPRTSRILYDNHYGWFENVSRGKYRMTDAGTSALQEYQNEIQALEAYQEENRAPQESDLTSQESREIESRETETRDEDSSK